jgi:outer membrane protein assembly factor BamB
MTFSCNADVSTLLSCGLGAVANTALAQNPPPTSASPSSVSPAAASVASSLSTQPFSFATVWETLAFAPAQANIPHFQKVFFRPSQTTAPFGSALDVRGFATAVVGRFGVSQIPLRETILDKTVSVAAVPACGPSPETNTMQCVNLATGEPLDSFPIPGTVSTQPLFVDGSWFFGTTAGFFIRTEGSSLASTPLMGGENIGFWGSYSRQMEKGLKPRTPIDGPETPADVSAQYRGAPRRGWKWYATSSAEFVGSPVVFGSNLYVLTAQQYLLALNLQTGQTEWSVRLAPEASLRLSSSALTATAREILVGTEEGHVLALSPKDGAILWRHVIPARGDERFRSVVAAPLVLGRSVLFSNAESQTTKLSLDGKTVEWSYPAGSVAQLRADESSVYLGGQEGAVTALESRTGALKWKVALSSEAPLASLWVVKDQNYLLAVNKKGTVFLLDRLSGKTLFEKRLIADVVGEFFAGYGDSEACLTFSNSSLRCFRADGTFAPPSASLARMSW